MAWPPRVRILGKNGQFIECRKRSLPSSPTAWVTCHGALNHLDGLMDKIWTNYEKKTLHILATQYPLYIHLGNSWFLTHPEINGSILGRAFRICKRWDSEASNGASPLFSGCELSRWDGEIPRNQDNLLPNISKNEQQLHDYVTVTCNITCTVYRIMNPRFLYIIAWLLDYRIVWWYICSRFGATPPPPPMVMVFPSPLWMWVLQVLYGCPSPPVDVGPACGCESCT